MLRQAVQRLSLSRPTSLAGQSHGVKQATYLKGLEVDQNAVKNTPEALNELLEYVKEHMPDGVEYRKHVEGYCARFLKIIQEAPSQGDAEHTLGRQFEEIIEDVKAEKGLIQTMARWKPWEVADGQAPKIFAEYKDIPKNVLHYREFQHELGTKGSSS
jgi:ETC complex I subunit conserved region